RLLEDHRCARVAARGAVRSRARGDGGLVRGSSVVVGATARSGAGGRGVGLVALKVLVTGAAGQVGSEVVDAFARDEVTAFGHAALDVTDRSSVLAAITSTRPEVIVHCASWTAVDACESDPDRAFAVNALGARHVMEAARRVGAYVVYLSTDYVFDG